ncbi:MAG: tRNA adenosine deaminase-associated protein [Actinocrinis sp.]
MAPQADYLEFDDQLVDFAVAAFQEDERWAAVGLPPHVTESLDTFLFALRQQVSEGPTLGLAGLGDAYFVAVRLVGRDERLFLSDAAAAADDRIAGELVGRLDPGRERPPDEGTPFGDQEIFADLGLGAMELAAMCERLQFERDLRVRDAVGAIAARIGFGEQFAQAARREGEEEDVRDDGWRA